VNADPATAFAIGASAVGKAPSRGADEPHLRPKRDLGFRVSSQRVEIFQIRLVWHVRRGQPMKGQWPTPPTCAHGEQGESSGNAEI